MGLYDRDYMREDRQPSAGEKEQGKGFRFPVWVVVAAVVVIMAFLINSC